MASRSAKVASQSTKVLQQITYADVLGVSMLGGAVAGAGYCSITAMHYKAKYTSKYMDILFDGVTGVIAGGFIGSLTVLFYPIAVVVSVPAFIISKSVNQEEKITNNYYELEE